jgi:hypothetical protein
MATQEPNKPDEKLPDPTGDQVTNKPAKPSKKKKVPQSKLKYFDTFSKVLAGIAFVAWMVQEWTGVRAFLFIAIVIGLADVFYIVLHKVIKRPPAIASGWLLFLAISFGVFYANKSDKPGEGNLINSGQLSISIPAAGKINVLESNSVIQLDNSPSIMFGVLNDGIPTSHITINFITPLGSQEIDFGPSWKKDGVMRVNHPANANVPWNSWVMVDNRMIPHGVGNAYADVIFIPRSITNRTFPAQIWLSSDNTVPKIFNVTFLLH